MLLPAGLKVRFHVLLIILALSLTLGTAFAMVIDTIVTPTTSTVTTSDSTVTPTSETPTSPITQTSSTVTPSGSTVTTSDSTVTPSASTESTSTSTVTPTTNSLEGTVTGPFTVSVVTPITSTLVGVVTQSTGSIVIIKNTIPNDPQDFVFTTSFGPVFILDDDAANPVIPNAVTFTNLGPGIFSVQEIPVAGFVLTSLSCVETGTQNTSISGTTANIVLEAGESVTCVFTNVKLPTLTVNKVLNPSTDPGKFNLQIDGVPRAANVGNGGTTGVILMSIGAHTVDETAGTNTNLANYIKTIGGDCAANGTITLAAGDNKVCTITNTNLDTDGDGIVDEVDTQPLVDSTGFSDVGIDGTTSGNIVSKGDRVWLITNEPGNGIRIEVSAGASNASFEGTGTCTITTDGIITGNSVMVNLTGGTFILSCDSMTVQVVDGSGEVIVTIDTITISIPLGAGEEVTLDTRGDGSFIVINPNDDPLVITVDGETVTIGPGKNHQSYTNHRYRERPESGRQAARQRPKQEARQETRLEVKQQ